MKIKSVGDSAEHTIGKSIPEITAGLLAPGTPSVLDRDVRLLVVVGDQRSVARPGDVVNANCGTRISRCVDRCGAPRDADRSDGLGGNARVDRRLGGNARVNRRLGYARLVDNARLVGNDGLGGNARLVKARLDKGPARLQKRVCLVKGPARLVKGPGRLGPGWPSELRRGAGAIVDSNLRSFIPIGRDVGRPAGGAAGRVVHADRRS